MNYHKQLSKYKNLEIVASSSVVKDLWFSFDCQFSPDGYDHAGFTFFASIGKYSFEFNIYDSRHWNDEAGRWETKEDRERERLS